MPAMQLEEVGFADPDEMAEFAGDFADFEIRSGVAVPDDADTLGAFKGLQRAINAYLNRFLPSAGRVRVDGRIGNATVTALNAVFAHGGQANQLPGLTEPFDVDSAAAGAVPNTRLVAEVAGVSPNFSAGTASGSTEDAPPQDQVATDVLAPKKSKGKGTVIAVVAGVGVAGLVLWWLTRKKQNFRGMLDELASDDRLIADDDMPFDGSDQ